MLILIKGELACDTTQYTSNRDTIQYISNETMSDQHSMVKFIIDLNLCLSPLAARAGYPIHSFCNSRNLDEATKLDILRILIRAYPESLHRESSASYLPIHSASQCQSAGFCKLLINAYPQSVRIGTAYGQESPRLYSFIV